MPRYGMDYDRDFDRMDRSRFESGGWRGQPPIGGMRSDGWGSNWSDFQGEEGWYGEGGNRGYDRGFRGGWDEGAGRFGGMRGGGMSGYAERDFGQGYGEFRGGQGGRDMGYGGGEYGSRWDSGGGSGGRERSPVRAAEIMTENPEVVTPDATLADVARKMKELDVGIIPVVESQENRRLRGVITDRDIAIRAVAEGKDGKATVSDCMTSEVETVNKNDSMDQVLNLMQREQIRRVPVTDREGRLVGIIAQADVAVDYMEGGHTRQHSVARTLERISEPAEPEGKSASGGRGRSQSSRMEAGSQREGADRKR